MQISHTYYMTVTYRDDLLHTVWSRFFVALFKIFNARCNIRLQKLQKSLILHAFYGIRSFCALSTGDCHGIHSKVVHIFTSCVCETNTARLQVLTAQLLKIIVFCAVVSCGWVRSSSVGKDRSALICRVKKMMAILSLETSKHLTNNTP
jgi:hypothetical protein